MLHVSPQQLITPRWYQENAVVSLFQFFQEKTGNPVIALPTGTGKSLVIGMFLQRAFYYYPNTRAIMLTHVKELIKQDVDAIETIWPGAPVGIFSSGLKRTDINFPIIYGGVASVNKCVAAFGWRDLVIIDECHLLSPEAATMYQKIIAELRQINPNLKVIGFSATPWRHGVGYITEGGIFTDICYDLTTIEGFARLIAEGYLVPLFPKKTMTKIDVSNVGVTHGEFVQSQLQKAVDKDEITYHALQELVSYGHNRYSWLVFASGIEHAEHVAAALSYFNIPATAIHSKIPDSERDRRIAAFKSGQIRCVVNNNVLTTGFDHPPIDLIGMLRPTMSTALWVQMLGRGTRPSPATYKANCLVLDFAGNTARLGPINDPRIPKKKGPGTGDAPIKICPVCEGYNHPRAVFCEQ